MSNEIVHIGTPRHSGRYAWGSGENPYQNNINFLGRVEELKEKGMSEVQIAEGFGMNTKELRAMKTIAKNATKAADITQAHKLKDTGMSTSAIGREMDRNESSVRSLLQPAAKEKNDILLATANYLQDHVDKVKYTDIGTGIENHIGVSKDKLSVAVEILKKQGYSVEYVKTKTGPAQFTTTKVLVAPGIPYSEVFKNSGNIATLAQRSPDGGRTFPVFETPIQIKQSRVDVRYAEEGGANADGVIYIRPGVEDISLGNATYAQVRIAINGTHYLKGMAMYKDGLPDGVDMEFNTNKSQGKSKLDAMKKLADDPDLPFGSIVRQNKYTNAQGKEKLSAINVVNDDEDWEKWSKNLSSQMLSKQPLPLAKQQLDLALKTSKAEYEEIMSLTNPTVRNKLLLSLADKADASAVHLKAAALPRQKTHVILPVKSVKDNEIYAPNYNNGESVVLVRYPHGGTFEIPELIVNNRNKEAKTLLGNAQTAVGINSRVAGRMSGADFDGDTVLVIPNGSGAVKTSPSLLGLKDFDPQTLYPAYEGMKPMTNTQTEMGIVSNLITDMSIQKSTQAEIARAVKHSMVVIDAEKHNLNYRQSALDNGIKELKAKYQGGPRGGAATLVSRSRSEIRVAQRVDRKAKDGGPIDAKTGRLVYTETGASYVNKHGKTVSNTDSSTKMFEAEDARKLSSGTPMEAVYATHANGLKALGNKARKSALKTGTVKYKPSAKIAYREQVDALSAKLNVAKKNAPLERNAQLVANSIVKAKTMANTNLTPSEVKKIKGAALNDARYRVGAKKIKVIITPPEWEAIQAGAIPPSRLKEILSNTDLDVIKEYSMPREAPVVSPAALQRARSMVVSGYTQAEIALQLGVSTPTLNKALSE